MDHLAPALAFLVAEPVAARIEIRINFGVFAGRSVTPAEIDRLAESLRAEVAALEIVAEERHEFGPTVEGSVHLVRVEVAESSVPADALARALLADRCLDRAQAWAEACISERHVEL